jgi:type IV pilus assembly protein PilA
MIKLNNKKGFTLIELMIVIAIIGILAAIAIPNFIDYRNKSFCSRAESDANNIAAAISDYFAIPAHTTLPVLGTDVNVAPTAGNTAVLASVGTSSIQVAVTDGSGRCPASYRDRAPGDTTNKDGWVGSTYYKYMIGN